jgi:hypothetical protein
MPAGDVFGLDDFFINKSNPITVSAVDINSTAAGAGITVVSGVLNATAGIATLTFSTAAGLSTTPFYTGAKIAVSGLGNTLGVAHTGYNGNFVVTGFAGTTTVSYATTGYVGVVTTGITTTGLVMLVTDTTVTNTTWSSTQTHGWFGGGVGPSSSSTSTVERINFSNDTGTSNVRGSLSSARINKPTAAGNSNYGWFGGGYTASPGSSTVDRIDFSNDSATASVRGPLTSYKRYPTSTGNSNYGWFGGGTLASPVAITYSAVDRIDFSNDSGTALARGSLSLARYSSTATGNSNYGWFAGGRNVSVAPVSTVDRIDFSNDSTTASSRSPLSLIKFGISATGNSNYGWFGGGYTSTAPTTTYSIIDRIDFSNDSVTASSRGPLSSSRYYSEATANSNYGWFGGGNITPSPLSIIDRINFSNDSISTSPRGPLGSTKSQMGATSGQARSSSVRLQKAGNYGWFAGGIVTAPTAVNIVDRIDFSNDLATASVKGSLSAARYYLTATGNSNYGWFAGGRTPSVEVATVDRIDFSNDSVSASPRGPLSAARYKTGATGNSNYGWFAGGTVTTPPVYSTVDRINFSNDSATLSVRGPLSTPAGRYGLAATGNSNYGWFGGGLNPGTIFSTVDRIDFSNDSVSAVARGPLTPSTGRTSLAATGNSNYGWFAGGTVTTPPVYSTVDRINFSNDSATLSVRGPLSTPAGRYGLAATGNSNYGWFGGGLNPGTIFSTVDRIDFSNDSSTASPRGSLSLARWGSAATSNSTR